MAASRCVAVIGPGEGARAEELAAARTVGRLLAQAGATVICGGLGGVMEATAQGVSEAGGTTLGILPGRSREAANSYVTLAVPTGMGELRNALVVRSADAVIAIGGSWGTLTELAMARQAGLPVVTLASWTLIDSSGVPVQLDEARSAEAAVARVLELLSGG